MVLYRFKAMLGFGGKFRLVAVLCSAPLALSMVRRQKELRAVRHLMAMQERLSGPEDASVSNEVADTGAEAAESRRTAEGTQSCWYSPSAPLVKTKCSARRWAKSLSSYHG